MREREKYSQIIHFLNAEKNRHFVIFRLNMADFMGCFASQKSSEAEIKNGINKQQEKNQVYVKCQISVFLNHEQVSKYIRIEMEHMICTLLSRASLCLAIFFLLT